MTKSRQDEVALTRDGCPTRTGRFGEGQVLAEAETGLMLAQAEGLRGRRQPRGRTRRERGRGPRGRTWSAGFRCVVPICGDEYIVRQPSQRPASRPTGRGARGPGRAPGRSVTDPGPRMRVSPLRCQTHMCAAGRLPEHARHRTGGNAPTSSRSFRPESGFRALPVDHGAFPANAAVDPACQGRPGCGVCPQAATSAACSCFYF